MPSWSPDGRRIAFVSRRGPESDRTDNWDIYVVDAKVGAEPRQVTTFQGADLDPEWGSRAPSWSPDGKLLAYVQGGRPTLIYYGVQKVAVAPVDGGPARVLTLRNGPERPLAHLSADGKSVLFLLEAGACHEAEDEEQHDRADPVSGRTPPVNASQRMTSPFTVVRKEMIMCCRSRVAARTESRNPARFNAAIARETGIARSGGMGVPVGITMAARSQRIVAAPEAMRKPVRLSAPALRW